MDKYVTDMGTIQPMGGLEILYDLSEDIDYKYIYHGETNVVIRIDNSKIFKPKI